MVSTDIGNICSTANSYLRFDQPASFFGAMSFGNCGYAFPAAMVSSFSFKLLTHFQNNDDFVLIFVIHQ
jgi:thiamine pyrophosphate-dependent acetolactate synthase large subunit-like protein